MDIVMAESFQTVGKVAPEASSEEGDLERRISRMRNGRRKTVRHRSRRRWTAEWGNVGSSSDSAGIGHMDALMKTMNRPG